MFFAVLAPRLSARRPKLPLTRQVRPMRGLISTLLTCPSLDSHIGVANRLNKEIPNSHILDQVSGVLF